MECTPDHLQDSGPDSRPKRQLPRSSLVEEIGREFCGCLRIDMKYWNLFLFNALNPKNILSLFVSHYPFTRPGHIFYHTALHAEICI